MTRPDDENINPYQAPRSTWEPPVDAQPCADVDLVKRVRRFRALCHALGLLWIVAGVIGVCTGAVFVNPPRGWPDRAIAAVGFGLGGICCALGIAICLKRMWAVTSSIRFGYGVFVVSFGAVAVSRDRDVAAVVCMAWFPLLMLFAVMAQAYRVRRWARQFEAAGIPLTARPSDVAIVVSPRNAGYNPGIAEQ